MLQDQIVSEYNGWDHVSDVSFQLYDAKLKIDVGNFKAGTIIEVLVFFFEESKVIFQTMDAEELAVFKMKLELVDDN